MTVVHQKALHAGEADALSEAHRQGFTAATKLYEPGTNAPHRHDYDVLLYVLEGQFNVTEVDADRVHACDAGDRLFVPAGTLHFEEHGPVRMVVGRRH